MMAAPPKNWPKGALPRRMTRENAAFYCGVSPGTFDTRVKAGMYPKPREDGRYDIHDLDAALEGVPLQEGDVMEVWKVERKPRGQNRPARR